MDIEAIRRKIDALKGNQRSGDIQMWKPTLGDHRIRIVPWKDVTDGSFAKEIYFYYLEGQRPLVAPLQYNKPDPVNELMKALYSTKNDKDRQTANSLRPKMRTYSAIIVRGEEDKGIQVWAYGKTVYQDLLGFFVDSDYGDITDTKVGFDLKVSISKDPKKSFQDTKVLPAARPSPLTTDKEKLEKWLETPDLGKMYQLKSYDEIKSVLESYLNPKADDNDGTARGHSAGDELEKMAEELKSSSVSTSKKSDKKSAPEKESSTASLDEAFAELMSGDEGDEE